MKLSPRDIRFPALFLAAALAAAASCTRDDGMTVSSPDGTSVLSFAVDSSGVPSYCVTVDGMQFVGKSTLGFDMQVFRNGSTEPETVSLDKGFQVISCGHGGEDYVWTQPWGENKTVACSYNEMAVDMSAPEGFDVTVRFRVFDDGVGFRYEYDVRNVDSLFITDELTEFNIANDGVSWSIPASFETYELLYRTLPISGIDNANTPMTFKCGSVYASIHEAALTDFPEMTLKHTDGCRFKAELAPWPDGVKARIAGGKFVTPWRTIQIGGKAVDLINSSLILNLNEPCKLESTDWIRPMKYIGIWWGMHLGVETWYEGKRHGATTANAKRYIDFAAENNIDAVMYEGWNKGWENWGGTQHFDYTAPYDDFNIEELVDYANKKVVRII